MLSHDPFFQRRLLCPTIRQQAGAADFSGPRPPHWPINFPESFSLASRVFRPAYPDASVMCDRTHTQPGPAIVLPPRFSALAAKIPQGEAQFVWTGRGGQSGSNLFL